MSSKYKMRVVKQKADQAEAAEMQTGATVVAVPIRATDHGQRPVPDQVAQSSVYYCNWQYPGAMEDFPQSLEKRHVARMYPYAKPSRLLVDFVDTDEEQRICQEKAAKIRARGHRYLVINNGIDLNAALEQLGEQRVVDNVQG